MAKTKFKSFNTLVYSTNPDFVPGAAAHPEPETLAPANQKLKIRLDKKHRAGKAVTLIEGFEGSGEDMELLGKKLKTYCGTGGSVKDGEIIVQGDNRDKLMQWMKANGYVLAKKL